MVRRKRKQEPKARPLPKPYVFVSYRRSDAAGTAGRLGDWLEREFGPTHVFRDLGIGPGEDFQRVIESALDECNIFVTVIGRSWANKRNLKRLDEEDDFVRIETVTALERGIPVLPVLVDETKVPPKAKLPVELRPVVALNAVDLENLHWVRDFPAVVEAIRSMVAWPPGRLGPDGLRYRPIAAGTFDLGAVPDDKDAEDDEKPRHDVKISQTFYLSVAPVTVEAYMRFIEAADDAVPTPPQFNPGWKDVHQPMVRVTWEQARRYCEWAGGRLATEAEWEHAARARRTGLKFPNGRALDHDKAIYFEVGMRPPWHPESAKGWPTNDFGLVHMVGNVWEWVADWYDPAEYARQAEESRCVDPVGPHASPTGERVVRGGSWADKLAAQRTSNRRGLDPDTSSKEVGFRCVFEAWPEEDSEVSPLPSP